MSTETVTFSPERFRKRRRQCGLTMESVAQAIGVSRASVGHWETGRRIPEMDKLQGAAAVMGCEVSDFDENSTEKEIIEILSPVDRELAQLLADARGISPQQAISEALRECVAMSMKGQKSKQIPGKEDSDLPQDQGDGSLNLKE